MYHARKVARLPKFVERTLWSYDLRSINPDRDRMLIITQALNYGTWESVRWVKKTYGAGAIREAIRMSRRGMWWPRTLNFWMKILNVRLPKAAIDAAVIRMQPDFKKTAFGPNHETGFKHGRVEVAK